MTLQQLKYIVAIDRQRNFAKAAEQCGISQPTLSAMLVKLEEELDVRIFERSNKLVTPTAAGEKIIRQAEKALAEAERITELVAEDKGDVGGELVLSVGPTIAPYILPKFIRHYMEHYPTVKLSVREMKADVMLSELQLGHLDAGIAISGNTRHGILEVPLYTERFMVYLAESCWRKLPVFKPDGHFGHVPADVAQQGEAPEVAAAVHQGAAQDDEQGGEQHEGEGVDEGLALAEGEPGGAGEGNADQDEDQGEERRIDHGGPDLFLLEQIAGQPVIQCNHRLPRSYELQI